MQIDSTIDDQIEEVWADMDEKARLNDAAVDLKEFVSFIHEATDRYIQMGKNPTLVDLLEWNKLTAALLKQVAGT